MKKLINAPDDVVDEALAGMLAAHPDYIRVEEPNIVVRRDAPRAGKVGLISGGGSGHEPMHGGFVGMGMLDAACPGVDSGAGVLHIVKNYTGDIMNFEMAAEMARAEGHEVTAVIIADDVAVKDSLYTAGRRGVGGTVLAEKIVGAAAEAGADLATVTALCQKVQDNVRSMGMALTSCTVPAAGKPTFEIADDEMEIGVGIHGEPGRSRMKLATADEITEMLATPILDDLPFQRGDNVLAFVNGLGGTPLVELYIVYNKLARMCAERGVTITRNLVGNYITSLEMAGCSITLLRLDDELTKYWDAPVNTPGLRWGV
jgi:dihydroxyacetone kinase-like protein